LVTNASVAAAAKPITGKLSKRGYNTVMALAPSGKAGDVRLADGDHRDRS
jgi:hypothetical protein